jgi:hypothetical protein
MSDTLKIAIIGDYNFTYNSHHATNLALDHSADFLELEPNYYWIKISDALKHKSGYFDQFDGIWIAPGPIENPFLTLKRFVLSLVRLIGMFHKILTLQFPCLTIG